MLKSNWDDMPSVMVGVDQKDSGHPLLWSISQQNPRHFKDLDANVRRHDHVLRDW